MGRHLRRVAIDDGKRKKKKVCLFEGSSRFGGRTYTARGDPSLHGLNVNVGAYRFAFEQRLPGDLIRGPLNLTAACYMFVFARTSLFIMLFIQGVSINNRTNF